jgi:hypothetical protein
MENDGSFKQVEITTSGLNNGPLVAKGTYPAVICCNLTNGHMPHDDCYDIYPHITNNGDERYIAEIENGTLIGYKYFKFDETAKIGIIYRNGYKAPNGKILVRLGKNYTYKYEISILGADEWTNAEVAVHIDGIAPLYLEYEGEGAIEIKEIYFQ